MTRYNSNQYGELVYGIPDTNYDPEIVSLMAPELINYLPLYYHEIKEVVEILNSESLEIGKLKFSMEDVLNQFFIEKATWGLGRWERLVDIKTDLSLPYEQRRSMVKAKIRGSGVSTKVMIQDVAAAFSGGEVEIIEKPEDYSFIVKFIGTYGIPSNIHDLTESIGLIKPAHLAFEYAYSYLWWGGNLKNKTWTSVKQYSWKQLRETIL